MDLKIYVCYNVNFVDIDAINIFFIKIELFVIKLENQSSILPPFSCSLCVV